MSSNPDDNFLYENRPPIREEFANRLYHRISLEEEGGKLNMTLRMFPWVWRFAAAFVLLAALALTLSTGVRASVLEWVKTIGGFNVEERSESPLKVLDEPMTTREDVPVPSEAANAPLTQAVVEPTVFPVTTAPIPEALQNAPFEFGLPQYLPEGYTLRKDAGLAQSNSWIMLGWENQDGTEFELLVQEDYPGANIPAGVDSTREVQINGEPALLILGFWGKDRTWDPSLSAALHWQQEGIHYTLTFWSRSREHRTIQPVEDMETVVDELVRIAESVR